MDWAGPSVLPQKRQQQLPKDTANVLSYAQWGRTLAPERLLRRLGPKPMKARGPMS